jgi:hypothetical protein
MRFRDNPLSDVIAILEKQNSVLAKARYRYLRKEAARKHFEANLIKSAPGKSQAEKSTYAQSQQSWLDFHCELAKLESVYEFERLKFTILEKEWQSQYLQMKLDEKVISKGE